MGRIVDCNGCGSAFSRVYKSEQVGPTVAQGKAWKLSMVEGFYELKAWEVWPVPVKYEAGGSCTIDKVKFGKKAPIHIVPLKTYKILTKHTSPHGRTFRQLTWQEYCQYRLHRATKWPGKTLECWRRYARSTFGLMWCWRLMLTPLGSILGSASTTQKASRYRILLESWGLNKRRRVNRSRG